MVRPYEENEREAHSEKNARCGNTREKKKRAAKHKMERRMQERHDRDASERGQDRLGRLVCAAKNFVTSSRHCRNTVDTSKQTTK